MRVAQKLRRLLAGRGRQPPQGVRQEDPRAHRQGAGEVRRRAASAPATAPTLGTQLFDIIEPFADYAFNKSHAYGYGLVAYQTAYLKAHYPVEYLAALLTRVKANQDKAAVYLAECRAMGIQVLVPDVNLSESDFSLAPRRPTATATGRHPLRPVGGAQRGRGPRRADRRRARRRTGPSPTSTTSATGSTPACSTSGPSSRSSRRAPSTPSATPARACWWCSSRSSTATLARRREQDEGVLTCSATSAATTPAPAFDERVADPRPRVRQDAAAGLREGDARPLRERPPAAWAPSGRCAAAPTARIAELAASAERGRRCVTVGGVVTDLQRKYTKKGDLMAVFVLEDLQAADRGDGVPEDDARARPQAAPTTPSSSSRAGSTRATTRPRSIAMEIEVVELVADGAPPLRLRLPPTAVDRAHASTS